MSNSANEPTPLHGTPIKIGDVKGDVKGGDVKGADINVTRIPLSADPTQPIKLVRTKPSVIPVAAAEEDWQGNEPTLIPTSMPTPVIDEGWAGSEATLISMPAAPAAATATPVEEWIGNDQTMVVVTEKEWKGDEPTLLPQSGPLTNHVDEEWTGNEQTMVGGVAPRRVTPAGVSDWVGNEATQIGMAPGAGAPRSDHSTSQSSRTPGSKATSPTLEDGWHLKGRKGALTGTTVGDYEMGGILGEGGMGVVYRAKQISLKRRAAVKVLPANLSADMQLRARFEQEARTASLLNTPHVVQVFGAGTADDIVYFAMEFVEGTDLSEIIHKKKEAGESFTPEEAAGYIIQAARGLAEAAKHNIVHRDIKPANLMVTSKGVVKIADFGISKIAGETGMTMTGTAVGTPSYCSPEQGRGDVVDPRADLYSLGVVFYELLAGRKPFDGTTANALIYQHNYQEPKLLSEVVPGLPDAYQAVCLKCLMKDPTGRYADAAELVADLERVRDGNMSMTAVFQARFGTGADAAMAKYLGVKKHWWVKWALAASFIAIFGGGGLYYWQAGAQERLVEMRRHKDALHDLDAAKPIPIGAASNLAWIAARDSHDADLVRWQAKIIRVAPLQTSLAALDLPALPDQATHVRARKDLTAYTEEVGKGDDVTRWEARLAATDARSRVLRVDLARDIDAIETLSGPLRERVRPGVEELTRLVGADDADAHRWNARLAATEEEITACRVRGEQLAAAAVLTEAHAQQLSTELTRLTALTSVQDASVVQWSAVLARAAQQLAALRSTLGSELDRERWLTVAQQEAIGPYLANYRAQVAAGEPRLVAWAQRLDESVKRVAALRKSLTIKLASTDALLSEVAIDEVSVQLKDYAVLVATDDAQLALWSDLIQRQRAAIDGDRGVLVKLEKSDAKNHPTILDLVACDQAIMRLDARGALAADRKSFYLRRLAEEKAYEDNLRAELKERENDQALTTAQETIDKVNALDAIAGHQDAEVKRWHERLTRYYALHEALVALDKPVALPPQAVENLAAFALLVSHNNTDLAHWTAKLQRVQQLTAALAGTELVQPLPSGALANATELVEQWLGADEPVARAWLAKATKVTGLRHKLEQLFATAPGSTLPTNQVLPNPGAVAREADELVALTGNSQSEVQHWQYRAHMLVGPGRPAWATAYERDAYGLYAELSITGVTQRLRWIPAGTFTLGSPGDEPNRDDDEPLIHGVTLTKGFWCADSECTQALWMAIMGSNPSRFALASDAADRPVERVSWHDVQDFLKALAAKIPSGEYPRLPSEAEWEYACRGGGAGPFTTGAGDLDMSQLDKLAWFGLRDGTRGVRRREPNRFGLFDMHGNVWEWCQDKYGSYSAAETIDPVGRQEETYVARGGSWADSAKHLRAANRLAVRADLHTLYVGFRLLIPAQWLSGKEPQRPGSGDLSQR